MSRQLAFVQSGVSFLDEADLQGPILSLLDKHTADESIGNSGRQQSADVAVAAVTYKRGRETNRKSIMKRKRIKQRVGKEVSSLYGPAHSFHRQTWPSSSPLGNNIATIRYIYHLYHKYIFILFAQQQRGVSQRECCQN